MLQINRTVRSDVMYSGSMNSVSYYSLSSSVKRRETAILYVVTHIIHVWLFLLYYGVMFQ